MKFKYLMATSVAVLLVASGANAADLGNSSVAVLDDAFNWDGSYGGFQVGYSTTEYKAHAAVSKSAKKPNLRELSNDRNSFTLGLFAGVNNQLATGVVLGAEVDGQYYFLQDLDSKVTGKKNAGFVDAADVKKQLNFALRARLGVAAGRFLPYLAAGMSGSYVSRDVVSETPDAAGSTELLKRDGFTAGLTLAAGVDVAVQKNLLLRVEYRYTDMGMQSWQETAVTKVGGNNKRYTVMENPSAASSELRLGLGFKY